MDMDNRIKTFLLLLVLTILVIFIGSLFGKTGLIMAIVFVFIMNFVSYWWSDKIILHMYKAKEADKKTYLWLYKMVEEVAKTARIPKPKVYIIPLSISNAFATGRNPEHACVAVTEGILKTLSKEELKGVIAHEISHIKNKDILIMTITATLAGIIMFIANMMRFAAFFGGIGDDDSGNIIGLLFVAILAPLAALLIQMAISRSREYMADENGARIIKNGEPLARALLKLHHGPKIKGSESTAHLFIVNPLSSRGLANLFSTHPPMEERVRRLRNMMF